jgi:hypothetical protein
VATCLEGKSHDFSARFLYITLRGDFNAHIHISCDRGIGCCVPMNIGYHDPFFL